MITPTFLLLVAAVLLPATSADTTTWQKCKDNSNDQQRVLGSLPDYKATDLALELCKITEIKPGDFNGLPNLTVITLGNNKIRHLEPAIFTPVNGLIGLFLHRNHLNEVPRFWELSLFPNMKTLSMSHNQISKLDDPKMFTSMRSLEWLDLNKNGISYIHPDIFKPLTNLQILSLHHNNLTHIPDKIFHVNSLRIIFLQNNQINYVAPGAIGSSKLETLFLQKNKLEYLPQRFVVGLKNASKSFDLIKFVGNPWRCGCLLEVLAEVNSTGVRNWGRADSCDSKGVPCSREAEVPQLQK